MQNGAKKKAKQFIKEFRFYEVTLDSLRTIIEKQGYTIIEFNCAYNSEHITTLITTLNIENRIRQSRGFTYVSDNCRLVFIDESLSDEEKLIVLAHEEGHIYCKHFSKAPVIGEDVLDEREANEFSHYILNTTLARCCIKFVSMHKRLTIAVGLVVIVTVIGVAAATIKKIESNYYGNYYITETGRKFHVKECSYIKDKTNIHRMTVEEYSSGKYDPCDRCLPEVSVNFIEDSNQ